VAATSDGHVLHCKAEEINKLEGPGRGVTVVKTGDDERVIGFVAGDKATTMVIENAAGKAWTLTPTPRRSPRAAARATSCRRRRTFSP
jgi:uncharacterized protein GlcG (DUF336 family)